MRSTGRDVPAPPFQASCMWQLILQVRYVFFPSFQYQVYVGNWIQFWKDGWCGTWYLVEAFAALCWVADSTDVLFCAFVDWVGYTVVWSLFFFIIFMIRRSLSWCCLWHCCIVFLFQLGSRTCKVVFFFFFLFC